MANKKLSDLHENHANQFLIKAHCIGDLRDEADFDNVKYHIKQTVNFAKDFLLNIEGTNEEKAEFLDKVLEDLEKFKVSK